LPGKASGHEGDEVAISLSEAVTLPISPITLPMTRLLRCAADFRGLSGAFALGRPRLRGSTSGCNNLCVLFSLAFSLLIACLLDGSAHRTGLPLHLPLCLFLPLPDRSDSAPAWLDSSSSPSSSGEMFIGRLLRDCTGGLDDGVENPGPNPLTLGDGPGPDTGDGPGAGEAARSGGEHKLRAELPNGPSSAFPEEEARAKVAGSTQRELACVTGVENTGPNPLTPGDRPGPDTGDGPGSAKAGLGAGEAPLFLMDKLMSEMPHEISSPEDSSAIMLGSKRRICSWSSSSETPTNPTACDSLC
jgi:hypothetical protein